MHFKLPYGPLRWVILFWIVGAITSVPLLLIFGNPSGIGIPLFTLMMAVCICLGSRGCAWTMLVLCLIGLVLIPLRTFAFYSEPVNWPLFVVQIGIRIWAIYGLYHWLYSDSYQADAADVREDEIEKETTGG